MAYNNPQKETIMTAIFKFIEDGDSLRKAVALNPEVKHLKTKIKMPVMSTVMKWLTESEHYARRYTLAMDQRAEAIFEDILDIADDVGQDLVQNADGVMVVNHAVIQRDRLRVDARKWNLSKMNPKKYGDRQMIEAKIQEIKPIKLIPPDIAKDKKK